MDSGAEVQISVQNSKIWSASVVPSTWIRCAVRPGFIDI